MYSGCLVTSWRCWPSAADEEWHSPKRPSSTVAIQHSEESSIQRWVAFFSTIPSTRSAGWTVEHVVWRAWQIPGWSMTLMTRRLFRSWLQIPQPLNEAGIYSRKAPIRGNMVYVHVHVRVVVRECKWWRIQFCFCAPFATEVAHTFWGQYVLLIENSTAWLTLKNPSKSLRICLCVHEQYEL